MHRYIGQTVLQTVVQKRFALRYRTVVLSVMLVYCGQTVGWIKMKLGIEVGLYPGHIALDGDPAPPKFSTHVCFGQMAGWIKMPLGTKVALGQGHTVRTGQNFVH